MNYVGGGDRNNLLYNRLKSANVCRDADNRLWLNASFVDSFHELTVRMAVAADGTIIESEGSYLRAPDIICFGCTHLVDLVNDISQILAAAGIDRGSDPLQP